MKLKINYYNHILFFHNNQNYTYLSSIHLYLIEIYIHFVFAVSLLFRLNPTNANIFTNMNGLLPTSLRHTNN